jgi:hypothetical protein
MIMGVIIAVIAAVAQEKMKMRMRRTTMNITIKILQNMIKAFNMMHKML